MLIDVCCDDCGHIFEYDKKTDEKIKCEKCGSLNTYRKWSTLNFQVSTGLLGNAANGYSKGHVYHTAPSTPKKKGTLIK